MKKIFSILMVLLILFSLVACSGEKSMSQTENQNTSSTSQDANQNNSSSSNDDKETYFSKKIDLSSIKAVEDKDDFGVKCIKSELITGIDNDGDDNYSLLLTMKNITGDKLKSINLAILVTDNNGNSFDPDFKYVIPGFGIGDKIYVPYSNINANVNESESSNNEIKVTLKPQVKCENINVIVMSYTTASGDEVENPISMDWHFATLNAESCGEKQMDGFEVSIEETKIVKQIFSNSKEGNDAIYVKIKNNSNKNTDGIFYIVVPVKNGKPCELYKDSGKSYRFEGTNIPNIYECGFNNKIKAGQEDTVLLLQCDSSYFDDVKIIVSAYRVDGKDTANPNVNSWVSKFVD